MDLNKNIFNRKPMFGNNCSKANNITKKKWNLNLQKATVKIGNTTKKMKLSVKTIRTLKKQGKLI